MSIICSIIQKYVDPTINSNIFSCIQNKINEQNKMDYMLYINNNHKKMLSLDINHCDNLFLFIYISNLYYCSSIEDDVNNIMNNGIINKFRLLNDFLNNSFISKNIKENFLDIFQKAQRTYYGFAKFAHLYKYKKATIKQSSDLYMNEIDPSKKNVLTIYQNNSKYLFINSDLIKIINSALLNTVWFFSKPIHPKNPYNNLVFDNSTLYNIYFHIKKTSVIIPLLFHLFFQTNFDLELFLNDNECVIRETFIKNYVNNTHSSILYHDLKYMFLVNYKYTKKIAIHKDISNEKIVNIFRPYLQLYYLNKYGVYGSIKKQQSIVDLKIKLMYFVKFNPNFGRKIYKVDKNSATKNKLTFIYNMDHINFYDKFVELKPSIIPVHQNNNSDSDYEFD